MRSRHLLSISIVCIAACSRSGAGGDDAAQTHPARPAASLIVPDTTPPPSSTIKTPPTRERILSIQLATSARSPSAAPGELYLTRPDGKAIGYIPGRGAAHDIPGATYDSTRMEADDTPGAPDTPIAFDSRWVVLPVDTGTYALTVSGVADGAYVLVFSLRSPRTDRHAEQRILDVPIARGATHRYRVVVDTARVGIERVP